MGEDKPPVEDNLFVPTRQGGSRSFSQSAEIFQELQQDCMRRLNVPVSSSLPPSPTPGMEAPTGRSSCLSPGQAPDPATDSHPTTPQQARGLRLPVPGRVPLLWG
ncbi:hypothetical protein ANANG_G00082570 [Anguilla anguilla]|uniref:Uncharacterized protein n=1 Tax=Anguilla anguilla TaxID=7936 RepID=A0A9D3MNB3_ANGAN|nr:hypothetical protein ANANG_G00082570 [Anguilla anguilla]